MSSDFFLVFYIFLFLLLGLINYFLYFLINLIGFSPNRFVSFQYSLSKSIKNSENTFIKNCSDLSEIFLECFDQFSRYVVRYIFKINSITLFQYLLFFCFLQKCRDFSHIKNISHRWKIQVFPDYHCREYLLINDFPATTTKQKQKKQKEKTHLENTESNSIQWPISDSNQI